MNPKGSSPLTGIICMWSGSIVDIPDGWLLCDGNNDTPDLRDRFILAAHDSLPPGTTGGTARHTHAVTVQSAIDVLEEGTEFLSDAPDGQFSSVTKGHTHQATTDEQPHLPPYFALALIIKQ